MGQLRLELLPDLILQQVSDATNPARAPLRVYMWDVSIGWGHDVWAVMARSEEAREALVTQGAGREWAMALRKPRVAGPGEVLTGGYRE